MLRPEILLYGCNVANGSVGAAFLQRLSQLSGADVAAFYDLTGAHFRGGDWVLERSTGPIEAALVFDPSTLDGYAGVLADFTVTIGSDTNNGDSDSETSLRESIIAANANPSDDTITLPAGTYTLGLAGANENAAATEDLDIRAVHAESAPMDSETRTATSSRTNTMRFP